MRSAVLWWPHVRRAWQWQRRRPSPAHRLPTLWPWGVPVMAYQRSAASRARRAAYNREWHKVHPDPRKDTCPDCGQAKSLVSARCARCASVAQRRARYAGWRRDAITPDGGRRRAQKLYPLGACEQCGRPGQDRHHKDGDTANNDPANVVILCRRCHMAIDGRLQAFRVSGLSARRARKTHCSHGHEYTLENTMPANGTGRRCRQCDRDRESRRRTPESGQLVTLRCTVCGTEFQQFYMDHRRSQRRGLRPACSRRCCGLLRTMKPQARVEQGAAS